MNATVHALLMRELKTRFGTNRLGYFWAVASPAAQASVMALIFTLLGRSSISGIPVALFLFTGILPFKFFMKLLPQVGAAVSANKALLTYRQVTAIDPIITRILIETVTFIVVYVLILGTMAWLDFEVLPNDLLALLAACFLLLILAVGIGLLFCCAVSYWPDTAKLFAMITTPMYLISGVLYSATMIPEQYWYLFSWNPIFHLIELSRDAFFVSYTTPIGDWYFVSFIALTSITLGLMAFRINRHRFIN
ncbi:ABC transporter permease [Colwellia sp. 6_MG-2023]|uniref:ABC transporter permease n=1 Tax=Colwellia sp. 6_MG-2023 TaxID=3062676 RepID=UPI0026E12957|nr:ABC transporter permease [Colwellia sp. 6_MG-2023]MDO6488121.1 ABC transporter permease [Colwellia sp. 6_MG-2023]